MKLPNELVTVTTFSKYVALALFVALPFLGFWAGFSYRGNLNLNNKEFPIEDSNSATIINNSNSGLLIFVGTVQKEQIPPELELGDYWFVLYFNEPYLLEENASGYPMYVESLVIYEEPDALYLENLDNKKVEIYGELGWGYSESRVIKPVEIRILE